MFSKSLWLFGWWLQSRVNLVTTKIVTVQIPCWGMAYLARRPPLSGVLAWCWWRLGLAKSRWKQELRSKVLKRQWNTDVWGMVGKARSLKNPQLWVFVPCSKRYTWNAIQWSPFFNIKCTCTSWWFSGGVSCSSTSALVRGGDPPATLTPQKRVRWSDL